MVARSIGYRLVYANSLEIEGGYATGKVLGEIVDADRKAALLKKIVDEEAITLSNPLRLEMERMIAHAQFSRPRGGLSCKAKSKGFVRNAISNFGLDAIFI
ncbi:MAG: hypothetical protein Ct9H90mP27_3250 [Gammaproteobacteria bacterium]|nr:MAG: hypothetical protein Ct9H90mP27_3250 [Gammaproteobacteria bacterium]